MIIVHKYKINCVSVEIAPGLADFLRGSIALYKMSKILGVNLLIDFSDHPGYKFLGKKNEINKSELTINEYFNTSFEFVQSKIVEQFKYTNTVCLCTNIFYDNFDNILDNESRTFIDSFFKPINIIQDNIEMIKRDKNLVNNYKIVQIRTGDREICNKLEDKKNYWETQRYIDENMLISINNILQTYVDHNTIIISDSLDLKNYLYNKYSYKITDTNPIHFGNIPPICNTINEKSIIDTLSEFFLMSNAEEIICLSVYGGSGFSKICSKIYNIPYKDFLI
jgi:hypothetical protein